MDALARLKARERSAGVSMQHLSSNSAHTFYHWRAWLIVTHAASLARCCNPLGHGTLKLFPTNDTILLTHATHATPTKRLSCQKLEG